MYHWKGKKNPTMTTKNPNVSANDDFFSLRIKNDCLEMINYCNM